MSAAEERVSVVTITDPDQMHDLGIRLGRQLRAGDLVTLTGPLGAGKTTLTRGIGEGLGVRGPVTSPTFVLARTHPSVVGGPALVHVDAYRLASAVELDDLDIDFATSVVVAEWGAGMLDGVADSWLDLVIERPTGAAGRATEEPTEGEEPIEPRVITITAVGPRWAGGVHLDR
ncbi:tRNA (adenosine(37)-N6)-threonylcarbamoyltransferase complex ATPase subunit type 1 TsaE [Klugiella xanthotipulae]|uniref:tRNA threonylcarbamoyladenosine biosynthesis protein TsaE n=1 Tax=Klugiella xanthotipulae TaxID=244735 RepID=A0A543I580_9MICO|nr:tRNA (adenosine(37)-N6)-threonylcarbamoyltransferase complex ATPase subunit type 1 TsaE [Klugiella xanthotipulae]TQM65729.1 tRNA threonylcarbamoyladenosine biosynthesis protein TsaE [Klugiella xanthotipulae]